MPAKTSPRPDDVLVDGALALGLPLTPDQVAAFATYREEVMRWGAHINLTGLRGDLDIVRAGFLDSLSCLPLIPQRVERAIDIGSGAGFPGLPVKIVLPDLLLTIVEASQKKATFLQHIVRRLEMKRVSVVCCRAETLASDPSQAERYELALARSVAPVPDQARLVRPFLRPEGLFLAQVGRRSFTDFERDVGFRLVDEYILPESLGFSDRRVLAFQRTT